MKRGKRHSVVFFDGESAFATWRDETSGEGNAQCKPITAEEPLEGEVTVVIPGVNTFTYIADLPSRDPDELEALVSHEFERRFQAAGGDLVRGHVCWENGSAFHSRALLVVVPESVLNEHWGRVGGKRAHIENVTISFDLLRRHHQSCAKNPDELAMVVGHYNTFADLLILQDGRIQAQRSISLSAGDTNRLEKEIQRTLLLLEGSTCSKEPRIFRYGPEYSSDMDSLLDAGFKSARPGESVNLLPESMRMQRRRKARLKSYAIISVTALLFSALCVGMNDAIFAKEANYLYFLEENTASLGTQAAGLSEMMDTIAQSRKEAELQYRILSTLNEIAKCAPRDVGIDFVSVEESGKVLLGGQAQERQALFDFMETLEASDALSGVKAVAMPLRRMGSAEVVDYRLELMARGGTQP